MMKTIQAKSITYQPVAVQSTFAANIQSMHGGGQPLPASARAFFEPRFGYDFSGVRVHTDAHAAETARALGAKAYTVGKDVVFGAGEYVDGAGEGRRLLAHELAHVVQQETELSTIQRQISKSKHSVVPDLTYETVAKVEESIKRSEKQKAIDMIVAEVGERRLPYLKNANADKKTFEYTANLPVLGRTWCDPDRATRKCRRIIALLGDKAFSRGLPNLYSTMLHEHKHIELYVLNPASWIEQLDDVQGHAEQQGVHEFLAYASEIMNLSRTGVIKDKTLVMSLGRSMKLRGWDYMSEIERGLNRDLYRDCVYVIQLSTGDFGWQP